MNLLLRIAILAAAGSLMFPAFSPAQTSADLAHFASPPDSARPWVYWFWLNGNLTRVGITADLEAMKRVGIGGVLIMDVDQGTPEGPVKFAGPEWRDLFKFMLSEANRLGLQVNMTNDAGWCGSGGPWITPELSMQRVVWSETTVQGGQAFTGVLPKPQANNNYYEDIAVLAMPAPTATPAKINDLDGKSSVSVDFLPPQPATFPEAPAGSTIPRDSIVDLTGKMDKDGHISWQPPQGKWLVIRFGHTSTGVENHPAPQAGLGLECDKFSKAAVAVQFNNLMGKLIADSPDLSGPGKALVSTHIDSWEIGSQNWTPLMREEFKKRRGYDLLPFLPAFTGRVVGSVAMTERFLWDLRQTVSDLITENYAGGMKALANQKGLKLSIEGYGGPTDDITYAGQADDPMPEFWSWDKFGTAYSCTEMTSAAHIYGHHLVPAESFTASDHEKWQGYPAILKDLGDWAFCEGINRFVFHRYAMQPWLNRAPGMSMGPWGLHYERTETWWEESKAWHEYLARCQYLLQQGLFVADVCYLEPEGAPRQFYPPASAWNGDKIRSGYNFDGGTPEVVLTRMSVKAGRLVLPDGMSYRALVLPPVETMTPKLLRKVKELVEAGATVIASSRPSKAPGLTDYPQCDDEVATLVHELWDSGKVITGKTVDQVLAGQGVPHDFEATEPLRFTHRSTPDAEIYFVANPFDHPVQARATFRIAGKQPELWHPDSGHMENAALYQEIKGCTTLPINLEPRGSIFVVFRKPELGNPLIGITRDGVPLWQDMSPQHIVIQKALYGILDDPARTRDVTTQVQAAVDRGQMTIPVAQIAQSGDPAPNIVKTLKIQYISRAQLLTATGTDPESIFLKNTPQPPASHSTVIHKALYGVPGDAAHTRDVTKEVQALVNQGQLEIPVEQIAQGGDPAAGVVKTVTVDYTSAGKSGKASASDGSLLIVNSGDSIPFPLDLAQTEKDRWVLESDREGRYELTTANQTTISCIVPSLPKLTEISGPWRVKFTPNRGAPPEITMDHLISLSEDSDPGVKYFSGTATYIKNFSVPSNWLSDNRRLYLDLGRVQVMAEVVVNGKSCGIAWKDPYRVDITEAAKAGENNLEIKVADLWINRMIGDENLPPLPERQADGTLSSWPKWLLDNKPDPTGRIAFSTWDLWKKNDPLVESGLLGPVMLHCAARIDISLATKKSP